MTLIATSSFAQYQRQQLHGGISICRYPPRNFRGPEFLGLAPNQGLIRDYKNKKIDWNIYRRRYYYEVVAALDPARTLNVLRHLAEDAMPIALCYEPGETLDTVPCHRRLVAAWLEKLLNIEVPEWEPKTAPTQTGRSSANPGDSEKAEYSRIIASRG